MKLIICSSIPNRISDFYYLYSDDFIDREDNRCLNNAVRLNDIALEIKDEYIDYIAKLNDNFIENDLIVDSKISLFHLTEISNKRTEHYNTFHYLCHVQLIFNIISEYNINEVEIIGIEISFADLISEKLKDLVKIKRSSLLTSKKKPLLIRYQSNYFCKIMVSKFLNIIEMKGKMNSSGCYYYTVYPMIWKENKDFRFGKSIDEANFIYTILTDGMHQGLTLKEYIVYRLNNPLKKNKNNICLEHYISFKSLIMLIYYSYKLKKKFNKVIDEVPKYKGLSMNNVLEHEFFNSFIRIPRLLVLKDAFEKLLRMHKIKELNYHLFEYAYGRMMTGVFRLISPSTYLKGYQHGPVSKRKLLLWLSKYEINDNSNLSIYYVPIPDEIVVEDEHSKIIFEQAGYQNVSLREEIPRLSYLDDVKRDHIKKNTVLIASGLHDGPQLFNAMYERMKMNPDTTYYFKTHPRTSTDIKNILPINMPDNIELAEKHISYYLEIVEKVICTYSSVGEEAKMLGIQTEIILLNKKINESPLLD